MTLPLYYLATPFSRQPGEMPEVESERFLAAVAVTAKLLKKQWHVISPIVHGYPLHKHHMLAGDAQSWKAYNENLLARTDGIIFATIDGYTTSLGVQMEYAYGRNMKKKMYLYDDRQDVFYNQLPDGTLPRLPIWSI